MADAPWRCSQCGTVNEPVANACRTCGRWPSLFELEGATIEAAEVQEKAPPELWEPETVQTEHAEQEVYEVDEPLDVDDVDDLDDDEPEQPKPLWQRLTSLIIPIGVVVYIVISALVNNDGG